MKRALFFVITVLLVEFAFGDEVFRSKNEIITETIHEVWYTYTILTDKGEYVELLFSGDGTYQDTTVYKYTKSGTKIIVHATLGGAERPFELERSGQNLILRRTEKTYTKVADIKLE